MPSWLGSYLVSNGALVKVFSKKLTRSEMVLELNLSMSVLTQEGKSLESKG